MNYNNSTWIIIIVLNRNLNLLIERGRYCSSQLPREERLCSICSESRLEDEKHFLLDCLFYNEEKNSLKWWLLVIKKIDFNKLDLTQKLEIFFKNKDPEFLAVFSKHVFICMKKRNDFSSINNYILNTFYWFYWIVQY